MKVLSQDVAFLVKRARVLRESMTKAVSNNSNYISPADRLRIDAYLKALKDFKAWIIAQPFMDLPQTSPREYDLGEGTPVPELENLDAMVVLELVKTMEDEIALSQSARMPTNMIDQDSVRFDENIKRVEQFLSQYVDANSPLDRPDSAYANPVVGLN